MIDEKTSDVPLLRYSEVDLRRWIGYFTKAEPSECVLRCVGLLAEWQCGTHHITDYINVKKIDWQHPFLLSVCYRGDLATFDFDNLTRLVFLAHDLLIRVELCGASNRYIRLHLHPRGMRDGGMSERHPTAIAALELFRKHHKTGLVPEVAAKVP